MAWSDNCVYFNDNNLELWNDRLIINLSHSKGDH